MAVQQRIPMKHSDVFPNGAYLKGGVEPVMDFEKSSAENKVQAVDLNKRGEGTGLPMWQVVVLDADEDARKKDTALTMKFAARVQPVPPENKSGFPWTPVEFVGLVGSPYVDPNGPKPRLAWSFRAEGMTAPGQSGQRPSGDAGKAA